MNIQPGNDAFRRVMERLATARWLPRRSVVEEFALFEEGGQQYVRRVVLSLGVLSVGEKVGVDCLNNVESVFKAIAKLGLSDRDRMRAVRREHLGRGAYRWIVWNMDGYMPLRTFEGMIAEEYSEVV